MNVLHINEWLELKGGVEVYINQLMRLTRDYGHNAFVIAINNYEGYFRVSVGVPGNSHITTDVGEVEDLIKKCISENDIHLINIHNIFRPDLISFCLDVLPVVKFAHGPIMVCPGKDKFWRHSEQPCTIKYGAHCFWHIYSQGCSNRHPKRVIDAWNYVNYETKEASARYKRIVVMSDYIKNGLLECGVPEGSIVCNPYFTPEIDTISNPSVSGKKSIVFIGRLISSKGPHMLLKSLMPLLKTREDVCVNIVGDGRMRKELMEMVADAGLNDMVSFHGWLDRENIGKILDEAYLVVFPSIYPEAFGIVGIEAMMHGKPVVAFDVGGVSTWLKDTINGYLVANQDLHAFQEKIRSLLDSPENYSRMCDNARRMAVENYIPSVHMDTLMDIYQHAIQ